MSESVSQVGGEDEEEPAALDSSGAKKLPFCGTSCLRCSSQPCSVLPVVAKLVLPVGLSDRAANFSRARIALTTSPSLLGTAVL